MEKHIQRIITFAYQTRFAVILLQFVANLLIPDHDAKVFLYPKSNVTVTQLDKIVTTLLGGFVRWDAQYFMHVAKHGYTYENTLAFFPLYPLIAKEITAATSIFIRFLNEESLLLITFTALNVFIFTRTAVILYKLTAIILNNNLAYCSAILFCINPATIFFIAPYTECLFSYLTFNAMLNCVQIYVKYSVQPGKGLYFKSIIRIVILIGFSMCVRSNGILNIGFVTYYIVGLYLNDARTLKTVGSQIKNAINYGVQLVSIIILCILPFALVQIYDYYHFCTNFDHQLPQFLVDYGEKHDFLLPGMVSKYNQSWCFKMVPLAYSYIQDHYWDVGFLRYFEFKQIPNFLLAVPVLLIILKNSLKFFKMHKLYCMQLGLQVKRVKPPTRENDQFKAEMFVFIVHAVFLTMFCVMCIHVQVTTRMVCSASPVLYWYVAYYFGNIRELDRNMTFLRAFKKLNFKQKLFVCYFVGYSVVGTVLFCNFLPWT